jgi:hypothetical protein
MKKFFISIAISGVLIITPFVGCKKPSSNDNDYVPLWPNTPRNIYYNLAWSSSASGNKYLKLPFRTGNADFGFHASHLRVHLKNAIDTNWIILPYVLLSNINQASYDIFYTVDYNDPYWYDEGGPVYIYAKQIAAINFNQSAIAGITYLP